MKTKYECAPEVLVGGKTSWRGVVKARRRPAITGSREEWLEFLFTHGADGILVHELSGRYIDANPAACQMLGYTRKELLALRPWDIVTKASRDELIEFWQQLGRDRTSVVERVYRRKDGELISAEVRLTRFMSGERDLILLTCRDISERKLSEEKLRASQELVRLAEQARQTALLKERNRIARDIHDTLAQGFTGIIVRLETALSALFTGEVGDAGQQVSRACDIARQSLNEARRSVWALGSQALANGNLPTALHYLIAQMTTGTGVRGGFRLEGEPRRLPPEWEENLLRIGQEALTNTLKYAQAERFEARLIFRPNEVSLSVFDDGRGFNTSNNNFGFGLSGMRQRVEQMGGKLTIQSAVGLGTRIRVSLPVSPCSTAR